MSSSSYQNMKYFIGQSDRHRESGTCPRQLALWSTPVCVCLLSEKTTVFQHRSHAPVAAVGRKFYSKSGKFMNRYDRPLAKIDDSYTKFNIIALGSICSRSCRKHFQSSTPLSRTINLSSFREKEEK